jgi:hypothetical protein
VAVDVAGDVEIFDWLTLDEYYGDTWHDVGEWKGATWPNEGLPRGTRLLAVGLMFCLLKFYGSVGFDPRTSPHSRKF